MPEDAATDRPDPAFLALLRCPLGKGRPPLTVSADGQSLRCEQCDCHRHGHVFPFTDGFPDLRPPVETVTGEQGAASGEGESAQ